MSRWYRFLGRPARIDGRRPTTAFVLAAGLATAALTLAAAGPATAQDGVELRSTSIFYDGETPRVEATRTRAAGGNLRIDVTPRPGEEAAANAATSTIFRGAFGDFLIVDHGDESFTLIDEAAIEDLEARLQFTMLQLDRKMAELPAEQRRRMRDALAAAAGPDEGEAELVATDRRETHGGLPSRLYELRRGEELVREVWVAPWSEVDGGGELRRALEKLQGFKDRLDQAFASIRSDALGGAQIFDLGTDTPFEDFERLGGLPVHTVDYRGGSKVSETSVAAVRAMTATPRDFLPPESYRQKSWTGE